MPMRRRHLLQLTAGPVLAAVGDLASSQRAQRPALVAGTVFARLFEPVPGAGSATRPQGFAVDLLDALLLPAGIAPTYELFPWLRAQAMIEQGSAQILVGPYRTREREARMRFSSQAFYEDAMVFYARAGQHDLWRDDFNALRTLQIGTVHGWVYGERFEQARRHLTVTQVRDLPTALRMLHLGRLDLIAANQRNSEPVVQELGLGAGVVMCQPPFARLRGHFAFTLDAEGAEWAALVDTGMQRLRASGELARLAARWGVSLPG
ncbi:substrate-binding periplasmic protein [Roseateles terrae]|uniref:Polar amino acid transport system substrate-binding protein n=1 Tax=Roseateles terrae TaxID=431060 RepID=A0ABR6GTT7_9BURK|nr:transporter substrate-binding domain-containing protein [Roseateles terrae]MBB3194669.1 polar amino acid transport system substrate-binding protein [Roseateles terrae]